MKRFFSIFIVLVLCSCATTYQEGNSVEIDKEKIAEENFKIKFDQAFPKQSSGFNKAVNSLDFSSIGNSSQKINISDGNYYVKFKKDSVFADLPFYGERYSGYDSKNNQNIRFENTPKNYEFSAKEKNNHYQAKISFTIKDLNSSSEEYDVSIKIFGNGKANMFISSSKRSGIAFRGEILN